MAARQRAEEKIEKATKRKQKAIQDRQQAAIQRRDDLNEYDEYAYPDKPPAYEFLSKNFQTHPEVARAYFHYGTGAHHLANSVIRILERKR